MQSFQVCESRLVPYFGLLLNVPADSNTRRLQLEAGFQFSLQIVPQEEEVVSSQGDQLSIVVIKADLVDAFSLDFLLLQAVK